MGGVADALAQERHPVQTPSPEVAQRQVDVQNAHEDTPAASPHTVEGQKILGVRASTVVFVGAVLFFVIVLFAAEISRQRPTYRRTDIDPRR
jgi:hypothetical protein